MKKTCIILLILAQILPFGTVHAASISCGSVHVFDEGSLHDSGFSRTHLLPFAEGDWRSKDTVYSCPSGTKKSADGCCCIPQ